MNLWKRITQRPSRASPQTGALVDSRSPGPAWVDVLVPAVFQSPAAESVEVLPYFRARDWFVDAIYEVSRLARLPHDWDTYGSPAVTAAAKSCALGLLTKIGTSSLPMPEVGVVSGGGLQFEWNVGQRALELEVLPDGSIEYLRAYADDRMAEGRIAPDKLDRLHEQVNWLVQHPA